MKNCNIDFDDNEISLQELYYNIYCDVETVLNALRISAKRTGFRYWQDATFIMINSEQINISICKDIYQTIARKYNKTPFSIERAMRLCFENTLFNISRLEKNLVTEFMKPNLLYPKNGEILCRIAELITSKKFQREKFLLKFTAIAN